MTLDDWGQVALVGLVALGVAIAGIPVARLVAIRLRITDHPRADRFHSVPTPYLGGVAVAIAVIGGFVVGDWRGQSWAVLGGALLVSCIGLADDLQKATPIVRLTVETIAALIAFAAGARVRIFGDIPDAVVTVVWLVGLTNAYNLLDNMDACASSIVAVSAGALLAAAALGGQVLVATMAAAVLAAAVGFLVYNWHPARIFLGDAGSLFLGFMLSATALKLRIPKGRWDGLAAVALVAAPALIDTTLVVISRIRAGRRVYIGGTDHTSHRLVELGLTRRQTALILSILSAVYGALAVAVSRGTVSAWVAVGPGAILGFSLLAGLLRISPYACTARDEPLDMAQGVVSSVVDAWVSAE